MRSRRPLVVASSLLLLPSCGAATAVALSGSSSGGSSQSQPTVVLDASGFAVSSDARFGIPLAFRVQDQENDPVRVVFQWRREGGSFPELPATSTELDVALADPASRRALQIVPEFRGTRTMRLGATASPATRVRLAELGDAELLLPADRIADRPLDVLRAAGRFVDPRADWVAGAVDLDGPVAAVAVGDGRAAWILDAEGASAWKLVLVDLATGRRRGGAPITDSGTPTALALAPDGTRLFVASNEGATWSVQSFDVATGALVATAGADALAAETGSIRGIAATSDSTCLVTVGSSLIEVTMFADGVPAIVPLFSPATTPLATPWGVVVEPGARSIAYVAERDWAGGSGTGRVARVDLATRTIASVHAFAAAGGTGDPDGFPRPTAIAIEAAGRRLLAITDPDPPGGVFALRALELGDRTDGRVHQVRAFAFEPIAIATGPDALRIVLDPTPSLRVSGGLEQCVAIDAWDVVTRTATVAAPGFAPVLDAERASARVGRLGGVPERFRGTRVGRDDVVVADARVVLGGGAVSIGATPYTTRRGARAETGPVHAMRDALDVGARTLTLADPFLSVAALAAGDLDDDGDVDLAAVAGEETISSAAGGAISIWLQGPIGQFGVAGAPSVTLGNALTVRDPHALRIADLDGDGRADLAVANGNGSVPAGNFLTVFLQPAAGFATHSPAPDWVAGRTATNPDPFALGVADLNGDGRMDLVCANRFGAGASVFYGRALGGFGAGASPSAQDLALALPGADSFPIALALGDANADGRPDVAVAGFLAHQAALFLQTASAPGAIPGAFAAPAMLGGEGLTDFPVDVAIADVDGDGRVDVACAHQTENRPRVALFFQDATGAFGVASGALRAPNVDVDDSCAPDDTYLALEVRDVDANGLADLVSRTRGRVDVHFQVAPRSFLPGVRLCIGPPDIEAYSTKFAAARAIAVDLDGDAVTDLATSTEHGLAAYFGAAGGSYAPTPDQELGIGTPDDVGAPVGLAVGDLDADGDLDVLASRTSGRAAVSFTQLVPGELFPGTRFDLSEAQSSVVDATLADFDADGRLDVLLATTPDAGAGSVRLVRQIAPGRFGPLGNPNAAHATLALATPSGELELAVGHLVGSASDGLLDVVVALPDADRVEIHRQSAVDDFELAAALTLGVGLVDPRSPAIVDLSDDPATAEDDGLEDLVLANRGDDRVLVFAQTALGELAGGADDPLPTLVLGSSATTPRPFALRVADVDANGRPDVVVACAGTAPNGPASIAIFLQAADGEFGESGDPAAPNSSFLAPSASALAVGDLDGDGALDLALLRGANVAIYLQSDPAHFGFPDANQPGGIRADRSLAASGGASIEIADVDGDRSPDLVVAARTGSIARVFYGSH